MKKFDPDGGGKGDVAQSKQLHVGRHSHAATALLESGMRPEAHMIDKTVRVAEPLTASSARDRLVSKASLGRFGSPAQSSLKLV